MTFEIIASTLDKRALLIGIGGPLVVAAFVEMVKSPIVATPLNSLVPIYVWGDTASMLLEAAAIIGAGIILPALVTAIAKRHAFYWGLLPIIFSEALNIAYYALWDARALKGALAADQFETFGAVWIVSSSIGLRVRWFLAQRSQRLALSSDHISTSAAEDKLPPRPSAED